MMNDQAQTKLIYNKEKVTYSSLSDVFELNFKKISRLVPLLPSVKGNLIGIKNLPMTFTFTVTRNLNILAPILSRTELIRLMELLIGPIFDSNSILMQSF